MKNRDSKGRFVKGRTIPEEERRKKIENSKINLNYGMKGKRHSEESKNKMSQSRKGKILSKEHKENISITNMGRIVRNETRDKISKKLKGHNVSQETRDKISRGNKGKRSWNKGINMWENREHPKGMLGKKRPHSEETKRKMSENNAHYWKGKKFSEERKEKMRGKKPWNKGIKQWEDKEHPRGMLGKKNPHSKETRKKISESNMGKIISKNSRDKISKTLKIYYINNPDVIEKIKRRRSKMKFPKKDSTIEIKIQDFLTLLKIEFVTHKYLNLEQAYQCDIFIPHLKLIIECDGDYWHGNPKKYPEHKLNKRQKEQRIRDYSRTKELLEKGYNVIRIWENEIKRMNLEDFKSKLDEVKK